MEVEIAELLAKTLRDLGVDVDEIRRKANDESAERGRRLAERLAYSVLPLFTTCGGTPDRIGSCVLARIQSKPYALTAAHVLKEARSSRLFAAPGPKGKLSPLPELPRSGGLGFTNGRLDVGILPLDDTRLGPFGQCVFLTGDDEIEDNDRSDATGIGEFYFVFGYPASRTQVKVSTAPRHINQRSFQLTTSPPEPAAYVCERISRSDYILLEFDHKNTVVEGKILAPPKLQGLSGGGIFRFDRRTLKGRLVAIAIEHRKASRLIVGTRVKHFLAMTRELQGLL